MSPITLQHLELELGHIGALALSQDSRRLFVGRHSSEDQARENIAVFSVDPQSGTLSNKRLYRDSDQPLPPTYTTPKPPSRPRAVVTSLLVAPRYRKLYVGTRLEDREIRPAYLLTIYDLDDAGEIRPETIRSYRAIADNLPNPIGIECMALHPQRDILYMAGGAWNAVRFYQLNAEGEPIGTAPTAVTISGNPKAAIAISPDGSRMYLGTAPATLQIVALNDGVPQNPPLRSLQVPDLALADTYLRFVHTPQALYAARPRSELNPPLPGPLYMLPLPTPDGGEFQRIDGFDHTLLTADPQQRLWLLRETKHTDALTGASLVDGAELVAVATDVQGVPQTEIERLPKLYGRQGLLATGTADPIVVTRATNTVVNYAAHEQVRFTIRRVAPPPGSPPLTLKCDLTTFGTTTKQSFAVVEGTISAPISLDPYLSNHTDQVALWLTFPPAVSDVEWEFEVQYIGAGAHEPLVKRDRVRGGALVLLVAGYAVVPERRFGMFELFSEHAQQYRAAAEAVQVAPADRPEQFVISSYSLSGLQGHTAQLDDGVATLRALGINSVQLGHWGGLGANEIQEVYRDLSPESGVYAPEFYYFFDFIYDGSLKNAQGQTIDQAELEAWAAKKAQEFESRTGLPISRLVRFQIADENGWYYPDMLKCFRFADPLLPPHPPHMPVDWRDETKNAAWIKRFQDYVAANDLILRDFYADTWDEIVPIGASQATTPETRRLFYWSMRFFSDQAALGARRIQAALEKAFRPAGSLTDDRPEHARLHVHTNFSETVDWQWYKPYPNTQGDKNPDQGPDAATGSLDWFDYATDGMPMASKTTYVADYHASAWSFYADLVRSAARRADGRPPAFSSIVPGFSMGDIEAGASYKLLALLSRGSKIPIVYAFGPQFFLRGVNSWSENFAAYGSIAQATELIGRSERVLYPAQPEHGTVAIHFPGASRLWDRQPRATFYSRELQPLHAALVHDGYTVDFVDDRLIESGAFVQRGYTTLYLLGPNLSTAAQQTVARWVATGGTLVVLPGAATADAFNTPTTLLDEVLGLAPRDAWSPLRESAHNAPTFALSNLLQIVDQRWQDALYVAEPLPLRDLVQDPVTPKVVDFATLSLNGAQTIATVKPRTGSAPERPAITVHQHGKGLAYAYAFSPGWQYWCTATHPLHLLPNILRAHSDRLPHNWSDTDRLLATLPARLANTPRSVVTSHATIEARRLQSAQGIAIVLLNWTSAPIESLKVSVSAIGEFRRITSVKRGPLSNTSTNKASASVSLPLNDVDVLLLEAV